MGTVVNQNGNAPIYQVPPPAEYGRTPGGAWDAANNWWQHQGDNDTQQSLVNQGTSFAQQAQSNGAGFTNAKAGVDKTLQDNADSGADGHQNGAINLAQQMATGSQPSQAAYQLQAVLNQATAQQQSLANSARGGAALATAGANAQANTANLQQNAYTQGGLLKSQDMAAGRGMLNSMSTQQRDQDQQNLGMSNQLNQYNAQQSDQYRLGMGQAGVQLGNVQNGQNQSDLAWYQGGAAPIAAQDEAYQQGQRWIYDRNKQWLADQKKDK